MSYYDVQGNLIQEKHIEKFSDDNLSGYILKVGNEIPESNGEIYTQDMYDEDLAFAKTDCNKDCNTPTGFDDDNNLFCLDANKNKKMCKVHDSTKFVYVDETGKEQTLTDDTIEDISYAKATCNNMCNSGMVVNTNDNTKYCLNSNNEEINCNISKKQTKNITKKNSSIVSAEKSINKKIEEMIKEANNFEITLKLKKETFANISNSDYRGKRLEQFYDSIIAVKNKVVYSLKNKESDLNKSYEPSKYIINALKSYNGAINDYGIENT